MKQEVADDSTVSRRAEAFVAERSGGVDASGLIVFAAHEIARSTANLMTELCEAEAQSAAALPTDVGEAIRELLCQRCKAEYPVWYCPNELWNRVQREGEHFFCPTCFMVLAEERGYLRDYNNDETLIDAFRRS